MIVNKIIQTVDKKITVPEHLSCIFILTQGQWYFFQPGPSHFIPDNIGICDYNKLSFTAFRFDSEISVISKIADHPVPEC